MRKRDAILGNDASVFGWREKTEKVIPEKLKKELAKLKEEPTSTTIEKGDRHYGLPPDAKERRM